MTKIRQFTPPTIAVFILHYLTCLSILATIEQTQPNFTLTIGRQTYMPQNFWFCSGPLWVISFILTILWSYQHWRTVRKRFAQAASFAGETLATETTKNQDNQG